jgi:hypothetical protein
MQTEKLLRRAEASKYLSEVWSLSFAPGTLSNLAIHGGGPPFKRRGRFPLYSTKALDEWAEDQLGPLMKTTQRKAEDEAVS